METLIGRLYFVHFLAFLVSIYMAVLVFRSRRVLVNRIAALLFSFIALWDLSLVFRHSPLEHAGVVRFLLTLGSIGWIGMPVTFFWFAGVLSGNRTLQSRKAAAFFLPSVVLFAAQVSGRYIMEVSENVKAAYGWVSVYKSPFWIDAYYVYLASYLAAGLFLLARRYSASSSVKEMRRIMLILMTGFVSCAAGLTTDVVLPLMGIVDVPGLGDVFALVWAAGMYRGITKYGLGEITPEAAADRVIETMSHSLFLTDTDGRVRFVNPAAVELSGRKHDELVGVPFSDIFSYPEGRGCDEESSSSVEGSLRNARDETPVMITRSCMKDENGEDLGWVCIVKDISDIRSFENELRLMLRENVSAKAEIQKLLEEKDLLLHEVHHRNKNNMNVISSLLSLQASSMTDPAASEALNVARSRVRSMMIMYDKLYRSGGDYRTVSSAGYFSDLIDDIAATYAASSSVTVEKRIEDIPLESKVVFPVGIVVNELITNAFKYAFPDGREGHVFVSFAKNGEAALLRIEDDGVGLPDGAIAGESSGFGLNLVRAMTTQIGGSLDLRGGTGTGVSLSFPL